MQPGVSAEKEYTTRLLGGWRVEIDARMEHVAQPPDADGHCACATQETSRGRVEHSHSSTDGHLKGADSSRKRSGEL